MEVADLEQVRNEVISFVNDFIKRADLPFTASRINDDVYRKINGLRNSEIDWDWAIDFLNSDGHFDLAIGIKLDDDIDGLAIGIYQKEDGVLEIQAIESFVRFDVEHPLRGRMVELTIIAATYFVTLVDGTGVHVIDPLDEFLIEYYGMFGFHLNTSFDESCVKRMISDIEELTATFQRLINKYEVKDA
ncbi:TPA: hypothetical protein MDC20_003737 [Morganella morganii]|uniref:hypothetical protein n=1 Tax=Morganella morganii TaxID=582 RepID=UPI000F5A96F0|nr:hypothetical protein [Morganella morganii]HBU8233047.1 hypothetical protein [Morganella morganii]